MGQNYSEINTYLKNSCNILISEGSIVNILEGESRLLSPYYNSLVETLETESQEYGAHYDETIWKTKSQGTEISTGNYCWIKIGTQTNNYQKESVIIIEHIKIYLNFISCVGLIHIENYEI